uniref:Uncharacterized protein n=1 Tax=Cajanus cajan TaxID=3821 RepID=A0A151TRD9_CAJCA|nr:hypothetical protein KK1_008816 [Cajanus cajan]
MLQFPAYMTQYPLSTSTIPTSFFNEIRKMNSNLVVIGKTTNENDKEDFDNGADDDDVDNAEESEGEDFEQETG